MTPLDQTSPVEEKPNQDPTHTQFVGSIPEIYDAHLGPFIFEFSAADLAKRVAPHLFTGDTLLEVACGTGIATEYLWKVLPPETEILATDLNQAMIDYAREKRGALPNVTFETADGESLPFGNWTFDAVVCQFGVMFFQDKAKGFAELTRVLKPGGLLAFNVWDSPEQNRVAQIAQETIESFFPADPPNFLKLPFSYSNIDTIKELLQENGFAGIDIQVVKAEIERPDAYHLARGFVEGNPGILEIQVRATAEPEEIIEAVADAFERRFGAAPLRIPLQEIVFTAVKPLLLG